MKTSWFGTFTVLTVFLVAIMVLFIGYSTCVIVKLVRSPIIPRTVTVTKKYMIPAPLLVGGKVLVMQQYYFIEGNRGEKLVPDVSIFYSVKEGATYIFHTKADLIVDKKSELKQISP